MTKLQLALDSDLSTSLKTLSQVSTYIDIAEIGTPLIFREGMLAVRQIRKAYPNLTLVADLKIMDAGKEEATIAFEAGADIVTVLGVANEETIAGVVRSALKYQGQIMADMMQIKNLIERGQHLLQLGCDILCVHTAYDLQTTHDSPYRELAQLRQQFPSAKLAIAGGVDYNKLNAILPYHPDIIIIGGAITGNAKPIQIAQQLYERIHNYADGTTPKQHS